MSFLAPLFLAGLAALAVPVLVHLVNRERKEIIEFPSLMFLQQIPYRSVRRQKIRHWLLFSMRALAMILLIAAFARPFFQSRLPEVVPGLDSSRELVVLLDRSYSMGYGDRWDRALDAARSAVDAIGPADRATVITFAETPTALNQASGDRITLRASIDATKLSSRGTRYAPALKLAARILEDSELANKEVVLITDFQKVGWDGHEDVELPQGAKLTPVDLSEKDPSNVAVGSLELHRSLVQGREHLAVTARITNTGTKAATSLPVELELGGRKLETKTLNLTPNSAGTASFTAVALPGGMTRGRVRAGNDALASDNVFNFVVAPEQALSVLIIEPSDARPQHSLYVREALIGDRPLIRTTVRRSSAVTFEDIAGKSLIILNDAPFPAGNLGRRIKTFVEQGGGLFVVLGGASTPGSWSGTGAELLPGTIGAPVDADRGATLTSLEYAHPIFELFSAPRSGDFTAARFYRYRPLQMTSAAGVLARFDDGAAALVEKPVGAGKVLVFTSSLDKYWNELPVSVVYLPFLHQVVRYAAAYTDMRTWFTAGQVLELGRAAERLAAGANGPSSATNGTDAPEYVAETPSGKTIRPATGDDGHLIELEEQGFYELRRAGGPRGAVTPVAVNLDVSESDLSRLDPQELSGAVAHRGGTTGRGTTRSDLTPEEQERKQTLWWYLLIVALLLLGAETVLSNRLSRAVRPIA